MTLVGARKQIQEHLTKAGYEGSSKEIYSISSYLGNIVREATAKVCTASYQAMQWLETCGRLIAKSGQVVTWRSPIGIDCTQPYRSTTRHEVATMLQRLYFNVRSETHPPHIHRQINGFAPHFVHSLDATHMVFTAIAARDAGIRFACVHESYWTHAVDMPTLADLLREQFVKLHKEPALEVLRDDLASRYSDISFPYPPKTGDFDLEFVSGFNSQV